MLLFLLLTQIGFKQDNLLAMSAMPNYLISAEPESTKLQLSTDKKTLLYEWSASTDKKTLLYEWTAGTVCGALSCFLVMPKNDEPWDNVLGRTLAMIPISITASCAGIHTVGNIRKKEGNFITALVGELCGLGLSILYFGQLPENTQEKLLKYRMAGTIIYATGTIGGVLGYNWKWTRTEE